MGTVPLKVGRTVCCHKVTRGRHSPHGLGRAYLRVDGYMQVGALGRRVGTADDRVPGFDSTDNQVAYSPVAQEVGWDAVVGPDAEEAEGTVWEGLLGIVDQPYQQERPEVPWAIQKSEAFPVVVAELYHP